MGLAGLLHRLLGLEGGQVEEVVEHALTLGQVVGGVVLEAVLGKKRNCVVLMLSYRLQAEDSGERRNKASGYTTQS